MFRFVLLVCVCIAAAGASVYWLCGQLPSIHASTGGVQSADSTATSPVVRRAEAEKRDLIRSVALARKRLGGVARQVRLAFEQLAAIADGYRAERDVYWKQVDRISAVAGEFAAITGQPPDMPQAPAMPIREYNGALAEVRNAIRAFASSREEFEIEYQRIVYGGWEKEFMDFIGEEEAAGDAFAAKVNDDESIAEAERLSRECEVILQKIQNVMTG